MASNVHRWRDKTWRGKMQSSKDSWNGKFSINGINFLAGAAYWNKSNQTSSIFYPEILECLAPTVLVHNRKFNILMILLSILPFLHWTWNTKNIQISIIQRFDIFCVFHKSRCVVKGSIRNRSFSIDCEMRRAHFKWHIKRRRLSSYACNTRTSVPWLRTKTNSVFRMHWQMQ